MIMVFPYDKLYKNKKYLYLYKNNQCPISISFVSNNAIILAEVDSSRVIDSIGTYDVNTEFDQIIDIIINFDIKKYREYNI